METDFVMKAVGIALTVAVSCQILSRSGRDDQATLVSLAGVITLLAMIVGEIGGLLDTVRGIFGL